MNELIEPVLWVMGLFTIMTGLLYVLTVIDPQTDRGTSLVGTPAPGGASFDAAQPAVAGRAAQG
jgi:hypothetical protein